MQRRMISFGLAEAMVCSVIGLAKAEKPVPFKDARPATSAEQRRQSVSPFLANLRRQQAVAASVE
jgi:hypothetical protein